jgi:hypothetical protein
MQKKGNADFAVVRRCGDHGKCTASDQATCRPGPSSISVQTLHHVVYLPGQVIAGNLKQTAEELAQNSRNAGCEHDLRRAFAEPTFLHRLRDGNE